MRRASDIACILAACLAVSCATANRGAGKEATRATLKGMVYDFESRAVSDALIKVDGLPLARSDINGRFHLGELPFGGHVVEVEKEGYEPTRVSIEYADAAEIVYAKLYSAGQLLSLAEKESERRHWAKAVAYLDRADAVGLKSPSSRYLRAVTHFRRDEPREARALLEALLADGYDEAYVHLFLADILQYSLDEGRAAERHLAAYLAFRYDPDVERRLLALRGGGD